MHQLLPLKIKIFIVVGLAFAISALAAAVGLHPLAVGTIVGIVEWILIFFILKSWSWLHDLPYFLRPAWAKIDLNGVWKGQIKSQYQDSRDALTLTDIDCSLEIRQSWQAVIFSLWTISMTGESHCACPSYDPLTRKLTVRYFFETRPTMAQADVNPPQRQGSAVAEICYDRPDEMKITYTNERGRGGDIVLTRYRKESPS